MNYALHLLTPLLVVIILLNSLHEPKICAYASTSSLSEYNLYKISWEGPFIQKATVGTAANTHRSKLSQTPSTSPAFSVETQPDEKQQLSTLELETTAHKNHRNIYDEKQIRDKLDDDDNVIHISTNNNERYMCFVPDLNDRLSFDTSAKNSSFDDEKDSKKRSPFQTIEPLIRGNFCSYKFELFWIYELCHGKSLRQYHEESSKYKAKVTQEYHLGRLTSEQIDDHEEDYEKYIKELKRSGQSMDKILVNGHHKPYVMLNMTGGTKCDLTNDYRVTKVFYVCNEEPTLVLHSIKETSTCEYEAIVLTPLLCRHADYKLDTATQHEIKCYSMDGSPRRPKKTIEFEDVEEDDLVDGSDIRKRNAVYLQGRTLIIDTDLLTG